MHLEHKFYSHNHSIVIDYIESYLNNIKINKKFEFFSKEFKIDEIKFCPYAEKRNRPGFVDISPTLIIDSI